MRLPVDERGPAPPFWLFLAGLPLALLFVCALHLIVPVQPSQQYYDWFYGAAPHPPETSARKVVAVGSSLFRHGLALDDEMDNLARRKGTRIHFTRFTQVGKNTEWLSPVLAVISRNPPDILVIEAELLALTSKKEYWELDLRSSINHSRMRLFNWLLWQEGHHLNLDANSAIQLGLNVTDPIIGRQVAPVTLPVFDPLAYSRSLDNLSIRKRAAIEVLITALHSMAAQGCIVVILPIGRSPGAAALFPPSLYRAFTDVMEQFSAHGFVVDQELINLPQECYFDEAHLNEEGRRRASDEFLARVPRWMQVRP